ncbi:N-acetyltransferase OS=Tsukamurella paurometabola (strain ATCC 8368 / DSM / CCUG 35730 / CIP 100753 / JCM 10117 / KCTC 9821 / NBRC 16120 / NCIMB 702349/ NCTC 13040) OX=521096 GN=NAT1 PE=3 SV=1 [Tsukamurella paurometabola]|uniref:N-acetyltransferase n=1 Tax=Tsukamurella paurometabola (strain ATCC 8368 / DSM 20162 / CCUG 35730 / CIP 100753 / JCM 10117 / KCTC 9821 / NBRC 16120 / NCIMB 702349 / NCTC 13040) TaxID=521096 RepID=D5UNC2_TSUPD|nr:arylamine N-acetyltransferase [Tsukamurella paurometabola]ADG80617.1 N-acetyltransferase [Tsukamurella paurometabola DSM 20162]CAD2228220.1 arylamine N-acetyltransferase [Tsukamurella paurometabola DSM 20162]SUP40304.1 Arylamine N-acetyltransferase [Tsukamurella paurometabola]
MNHDEAWGADELDLDRYLRRVGLDAPVAADPDGLARLVAAHATTLPWENIDAVRGIPGELTIGALQRRMIDGRRGYGCTGHTPLLAAVLQRHGFVFSAVAGRVLLQGETSASTHALLVVQVDGARWLVEVGFGAVPLAPLRLVDGLEQDAGGWTYRVTRSTPGFAEEWQLDFFDPSSGQWRPQYRFPLAARTWSDLRMTNYYVATSPFSPFRGRLMVVMNHPDRRLVLTGDSIITTRPDGFREVAPYPAADRREILAEAFAIDLSDEVAAEVDRLVENRVSAS